jgi:hypothetical protein
VKIRYGKPRPARTKDQGHEDHFAGPPCAEGKCKLCLGGSQPITPVYAPVYFD